MLPRMIREKFESKSVIFDRNLCGTTWNLVNWNDSIWNLVNYHRSNAYNSQWRHFKVSRLWMCRMVWCVKSRLTIDRIWSHYTLQWQLAEKEKKIELERNFAFVWPKKTVVRSLQHTAFGRQLVKFCFFFLRTIQTLNSNNDCVFH